jgi:hypothetical protein
MAVTNPPPIRIPREWSQDPELNDYANTLHTFLRLLWQRTGGGTDLIEAGVVDLTALNAAVNLLISELNTAELDILTNAADILTNTGDIATNAGNIATNTGDIATNTADIATNTADIATNAAGIATNVTDIATVAFSFALALAQANTLIEELQAQDDGSIVGYDALRRIKRRGWREIRCNLSNPEKGAGTSSLVVFGPSGVSKVRSFSIGGEVFLQWEVPHDCKPGTTAYFHVHWTTNAANTGPMSFELSYTLASGYNQSAFPADTLITFEEAASGTAYRHMTTDGSAGFTMPEPGSVIVAKFTRVTPSAGSNPNQCLGLYVDIDYESSLDDFTPQRTPDFYARP